MKTQVDSIGFYDRRISMEEVTNLDTEIDQGNAQSNNQSAQAQLKKYSNQSLRFANEELKQHSRLGDVQQALKVLQPEQLLEVLKSTRSALDGKGGMIRIETQDMPELMAPKSRSVKANDTMANSARMMALLGKVSQLAADNSAENLIAKLKGYTAMMAGVGNGYSSLASDLEKQGERWAQDSDALKEAQRQANAFSNDISKTQSALNSAQTKLDHLELKASTQDPVTESLQIQIDEAKAAIVAARTDLDQTTKAYDSFVDKTLNPAISAEKASRTTLETIQAQSKKLIDSLSSPQQNSIESQRKQKDEQAKSLTFLLALMSQLIDKSASEDLNAAAELKQKLSEATAKDAEKKAREYEEEVRKAEELQKTMGCIGKIFGWLITAVSFALAAFTGGASLAIAAVGLALAAGDEISQAVSGHSFMADAINAIIKPLMELLSKMFSAMLEEFGVDKATADMVGQILGAVGAAVALIGGMMLAKSAISKVSGEVMKRIGTNVTTEASKAMGKSVASTVTKEVAEEVGQEVAKKATKTMMQRMTDSMLGQMFKRISQGYGRSMGMNNIKMAQVANRSEMALVATRLSNTAVQSAGGIIVADMMVEAAKARAQMLKDAAMQELLNEIFNSAVDAFAHRMEMVNQIIKNISAVAENQMQAGKYITKQMSNIAG